MAPIVILILVTLVLNEVNAGKLVSKRTKGSYTFQSLMCFSHGTIGYCMKKNIKLLPSAVKCVTDTNVIQSAVLIHFLNGVN